MKFVLQPWQLFVVVLASWINRQQQEVIEYLRTESAVLKEEFKSRRHFHQKQFAGDQWTAPGERLKERSIMAANPKF